MKLRRLKPFRWNNEKNIRLKKERGVSFEEIVEAVEEDHLLDDLIHHNLQLHPNQRLFIVSLREYVYVVPYIEETNAYFLKTIYPDSDMKKRYLRQGEE